MKKLWFLLLLFIAPLSWAAEQQVTIDVAAMTCPLCVTVVNQVLRETDGVIKAKSSLKTKSAVVIVPEGFEIQRLVQAIDKTGYKGVISKVESLP